MTYCGGAARFGHFVSKENFHGSPHPTDLLDCEMW
jgi:hypothetical protein